MKRNLVIIGFLLVIVSLLFTSCMPVTVEEPETLFNKSLNKQIEEITTPKEPEGFKEFFFNYTPRAEAKYEIARDDIFTITRGDFESTEISFLGVMLGDSYEDVLERLGIPDVMFIPRDESYKNMEYRNKIGINGTLSGLTFHLENDTVTRITVKPAFNKYLQGNTSLGQSKELIYALLDIPDYQDFVTVYRIFHYVEKGMELYFRARNVNRMSFIFPQEFKGVEYITTPKIIEGGIITNITQPVLIE